LGNSGKAEKSRFGTILMSQQFFGEFRESRKIQVWNYFDVTTVFWGIQGKSKNPGLELF
jgi:hypothetical protein